MLEWVWTRFVIFSFRFRLGFAGFGLGFSGEEFIFSFWILSVSEE